MGEKQLKDYEKELKELELISKAVGILPDMVQGGGGNTSVKLDGQLMAVKASGFALKQITPMEGYVVVNYADIKNYYENVDFSSGIDYEKDATDYAKKCIVKFEGLKELRPSVEAGFHSFLKKYVIHTHPVYANILCCSKTGRETVQRLFGGKDYGFLWIPYINPGFTLSLKIKEGIEECLKTQGRFPEVIFMENHGLIVSSDDPQQCIDLHAEVNRLIREDLGITESYPEIKLVRQGEETMVSQTGYLTRFIRENGIEPDFFSQVSLYPDQLVYLNSNIPTGKLGIDSTSGKIIYKAGEQEAMTIEETLLGYIYVVDHIRKCGLPIKTMSSRDTHFINNWESEKYRKTLVQEKDRK